MFALAFVIFWQQFDGIHEHLINRSLIGILVKPLSPNGFFVRYQKRRGLLDFCVFVR